MFFGDSTGLNASVRCSSTFRWIAVLVTLLAAFSLTFSFRPRSDATLNSLQSRQLALHGDVNLNSYKTLGGYFIDRGRETFSIYGTGISLVSLPFYLVLLRFTVREAILQGVVACFFVSLAVLLMLMLLLKLVPRILAVSGALIFGFGTTLWATASTALWQQGPALAFEVLGLIAVFSENAAGPLLAGLELGAAGFIRLPLMLCAVTFLFFYIGCGRRSVLLYLLGSLPWAVGRLIENEWLWGNPLRTGYSFERQAFGSHVMHGILGELTSWRRGLLVYSPILVIGVAGIAVALRRWHTTADRRLFFVAVNALGLVVIDGSRNVWWGGERQFGYRLLLDAAPMLLILTIIVVSRRRALLFPAVVLGCLSMIIMAAGSVPNANAWDTSYPQNELSLSPLSHALDNAIAHPASTLWRLGVVLVVFVLLRTWAPVQSDTSGITLSRVGANDTCYSV